MRLVDGSTVVPKPAYVWRDPGSGTIGVGFHASSEKNGVTLTSNALGGQLTVNPKTVQASVEVVRVEVAKSNPTGAVAGNFSVQALTALAKFGIEELASKEKTTQSTSNGNTAQEARRATPSLSVFSAGVEAHIAKTTIAGSLAFGPVKVEASFSVGVGAAAGFSVGAGSKGLQASATAGAGATLGGSLGISWR